MNDFTMTEINEQNDVLDYLCEQGYLNYENDTLVFERVFHGNSDSDLFERFEQQQESEQEFLLSVYEKVKFGRYNRAV